MRVLQLRHENIVRLHTFIMTPNKYYLVMEYCQGACTRSTTEPTALDLRTRLMAFARQ